MLSRHLVEMRQCLVRRGIVAAVGPPSRGITTKRASKKKETLPVPAAGKNETEAAHKAESLARVMKELNSKWSGQGGIMFASEMKQTGDVLKTGVLTLDIALGGGFPKGRVIEIYGPESSGKTTLALQAIKEVQRKNKAEGAAVLVDAEHAFDPRFARKMGIDLTKLAITKPDYGEMALEQVQAFVNSNAVDLIVIDSVAALIPKTELEGEMNAPQMGSHARLMSAALKKLVGSASDKGTTLIFINQIRNKIGVIFGNPETTTGGKSLLFYASVRIDLRKTKKISAAVKGEESGIKVRAKIQNTGIMQVVKSKTSNPFKEAEFDILFASGIDEVGCVFDAGLKTGVIKARGSHYYLGEGDENKLGQGREKVIEILKGDEAKLREIEDKVHASITDSTDGSVLLQSDGNIDFGEDGQLLENEEFPELELVDPDLDQKAA